MEKAEVANFLKARGQDVLEDSQVKFGYTLLYVQDVPRTVEFYESAFGLRRAFISESGQYAEMDTGATKLGFVAHELVTSQRLPFTAVLPAGQSPAAEIAFVSEQVAEACTKAVQAGAEALVEPRQKPWGQIVAYVRDNNGFLGEICPPL